MAEAKTLGIHIHLDLYDCRRYLNDITKIESLLVKSAQIAGATILKTDFHQFNPHGVSGYILIAESHISMHSWPEHGFIAVDLFTCSEEMNHEAATDYLISAFMPKTYHLSKHKRGRVKHPSIQQLKDSADKKQNVG